MRHSLPKVRSLDFNREVTVADIEQLVGESEDFDHRAFECLGKNCGAPVTLANWFTPEAMRRQARHFRSFHHTADCEYLIYLRTGGGSSESNPTSASVRLHAPDRFDPAEDEDEEHVTPPEATRAADSTTPSYGEVLRPEDKPLRCLHLGQLVRRYRRLSLSGEIAGRTVIVSGQTVEYDDLFQPIEHQEAQDQQGLPRIWFGTATIKKVSKGYRILFEGFLQWGKAAFHPAFHVRDQWLNWYPEYPSEIKNIFRESEQLPVRVNVFAMGDLKETRVNEKVFLNIRAYKRSEFWMERDNTWGDRHN